MRVLTLCGALLLAPMITGGALVEAAQAQAAERYILLSNAPASGGGLRQVVAEHVKGFELMDDAYLRERASDVKDLGRRLSGEVAKAVRSQLATERLGEQGFDAVGSTPEEFSAFLEQELVKYTRIVKQANVKIE